MYDLREERLDKLAPTDYQEPFVGLECLIPDLYTESAEARACGRACHRRYREAMDIMLKKNYSKTRKFCRVTFKLPASTEAETAAVLGDFNDWNPEARLMTKLKKGGFSVTVSLPAPAEYRFRYLLDGERWENDDAADGYRANEFGTEDGILVV